MSRYVTRVCGPTQCPVDLDFEHEGYFGCNPKDFNQTTGKSATHTQSRGSDGLYAWDGGCGRRQATSTPSPKRPSIQPRAVRAAPARSRPPAPSLPGKPSNATPVSGKQSLTLGPPYTGRQHQHQPKTNR